MVTSSGSACQMRSRPRDRHEALRMQLPAEGTPQARFGALVRHHMDLGTRPTGARDIGAWTVDALAGEIRAVRRTVERYRNGAIQPPDAEPLADAFFGKDRRLEAARAVFLIAYAAATGTDPPPGAFATSNVPVRVPAHFIGRDKILVAVRSALTREAGRVAVVALHGLHGVGKSVVAAAYADRHRADYRATWWVRAESDTLARADLVALGVRLGWIGDDRAPEAFTKVAEKLRIEGDGVLLILDGACRSDGRSTAEGLRGYIPIGGASHCIVTSTDPALRSIAHVLEVGLWTTDESASYLVEATGRADEARAAAALSDEMGRLPLALEQAAAYCDFLDIPIEEYLRRFRAAPASALDQDAVTSREYRNGLTVAKTFSLAIDAADGLVPGASAFIGHVAALPPAPVPLRLFTEVPRAFYEPLGSTASKPGGIDAVVAVLRSFSLIHRESVKEERSPGPGIDSVRLHSLVRIVAAARSGDELPDMLGALFEALVAVYPRDIVRDNRNWHLARCLDEIADHLAGKVPAGRVDTAELAAFLPVLAASEFEASARYDRAERRLSRALELAVDVHGPESDKVASVYDNLASVHRARDNFPEARRCREHALALREAILGPSHPDTLTSKQNLGNLLSHFGRCSEALVLYEAVIDAYERSLGAACSENPKYLNVLANYAVALRADKSFDRAHEIQEKILRTRERLLPKNDVRLASSYASFSVLLKNMNDLDQAIDYCKRALFVRRRAHGATHPDVATSLNNLGNIYRIRRRLTRAKTLHECALRIRKIVYGVRHTETAMSFNNLGMVLRDMNDADAAIENFRKALSIFEGAFGVEHPHTKDAQENLASIGGA